MGNGIKSRENLFFPIFFHKRNTNDAHMDNFSKKMKTEFLNVFELVKLTLPFVMI